MFLIDRDNDWRWFVVPADKIKDFERWKDRDVDDPKSWKIPDFLIQISSPQDIRFDGYHLRDGAMPVPERVEVKKPLVIGAEVEWTSSNATKIGVIEVVVPAGVHPGDLGIALKDPGPVRSVESYIIRGQINGSGRKRLYWPKTEWLKGR